MEQKYKVLYNIFNQFLLKSNCIKVKIELGDAFDLWSGDKFWCERGNNNGTYIPYPLPIGREISEYVENIVKNDDLYYSSNDGEEFYNFEFVILPEERTIEIYGVYSVYGTEDNQEQVIEAEEEPEVFNKIFEYLDSQKVDVLEVDVNAGGDSGWIEDEAYDINGVKITVTDEMQDVGYRLLNNFPGWEINEGSTSKFIWDRHRRVLIFEFAYNYEEQATELISKETY